MLCLSGSVIGGKNKNGIGVSGVQLFINVNLAYDLLWPNIYLEIGILVTTYLHG